MNFLYFILIGAVAGFLAGKIMKGSGYGLIGDIIVGVIGGLIGGWLFGLMGIANGGLIGALITAVVGAVVLIWILRLVSGKRT
ncbi:MAG: GlsB/YeaQ/YmgE family stress response membrane protein [Chitinophagales bacterium]|nr:GlsB/YeaQ/YmgE family stress response membrane protein [Chitinophagales bacterium]